MWILDRRRHWTVHHQKWSRNFFAQNGRMELGGHVSSAERLLFSSLGTSTKNVMLVRRAIHYLVWAIMSAKLRSMERCTLHGPRTFLPKIEEWDLVDIWFQHDCVRCHIPHETINHLGGEIGELLTLCCGSINLPHWSCYFTPLDYFLWGREKSLVCF